MSEADLLAQALRHAQHGDFTRAEMGFREILRSNPGSIDAKFGLATVLATQGQSIDAIVLLREVIQAQPNHLAALINLGNALMQIRNPAEAEQPYRAALQLRPDLFPAIYGLGCVLQQHGRSAEAESCFRKALQAQPNDPGLWVNLGTTLRQQHKLSDAIEAYRQAVQIKPDLHPGWSALGQTLLEFKRPREAEQAFQYALAITPNITEARIGLGDALCGQRHDDAALESYLSALALDPQSQNAHTKVESLLLRMAGALGSPSLFERFLENRIYNRPSDSVQDALALLDAYTYPMAGTLDETRTLLQAFDPEQLYPDTWWKDRLSRFGNPAEGHDKVFRGISSALYSWSPPSRDAIEAVASFTGDAVLHSFGAGTGYWEWLLARHFGTRILAGDQVLRHRYVDMVVEDYGTAAVGEGEVVFLAWIPQGVDVVMNLLRQLREGQKLVIVGQGPDDTGKARICATDDAFQFLATAFKPAGNVPLGYYSYIRDDVCLYLRR
ncbi:MAG: tetratricopeptide repeat protein [Gammaproteobacteria bacterium]|nr:tetratricopeptide repeat protein [Gammaproteobacteria bacterium]